MSKQIIILNCPGCDRPFEEKGYNGRPRKYCSVECKQKCWRKKKNKQYRDVHPKKLTKIELLEKLILTGIPYHQSELIELLNTTESSFKVLISKVRKKHKIRTLPAYVLEDNNG